MRQPVWFLSHGAPTFLTEPNRTTAFWSALGAALPTDLRAVLCVSAHWESPQPALSGAVRQPAIQHDFYGFPDTLYAQTWPARGDATTGTWLGAELAVRGVPVAAVERPFDHGLWVPFKFMWPAGPPCPVFQLSLSAREDPAWHLRLGEALAPLRAAGVLIVGSGGITHNLREIDWHAGEGQAATWATAFMAALEQALQRQDLDALCRPWDLPYGRRAHPSLEHYLPFLVALGAAGAQSMTPRHRNWLFGTLALHAYASDAGD